MDNEFLRYPIPWTLTIRNPVLWTLVFRKSHFSDNECNQLTAATRETLDSYSSTAYTYDANGNQTSRLETNLYTQEMKQALYAYDATNRLKTATGKTGNILDYVQENKNNGFGQRVQKDDTIELCKRLKNLWRQ